MQSLQNEVLPHVRNKIGDAVAEIARQYADDGKLHCTPTRPNASFDGRLIINIGEPWPELLGVLFHMSQSADAGQREGAFRIFATTPAIIEKQHEDLVQSAFTKGFKDDNVSVSF